MRFSVRSAIVLCAALGCALPLAAEARQWNATPQKQALDYAQIQHQVGRGDYIFLQWNPPEALGAKGDVADLLRQYVVLLIVHMHLDPSGRSEFRPIKNISVVMRDGSRRLPIKGDAVPPTLQGFVATLSSGMRGALGRMGQGMQVLVFDGSGIHSCKPGGFAVSYNGETYTYDTPIPGCP